MLCCQFFSQKNADFCDNFFKTRIAKNIKYRISHLHIAPALPFTCFKNRNGSLGKAIFRIHESIGDYGLKVEGETMMLDYSNRRSSAGGAFNWRTARTSLQNYGTTVFSTPATGPVQNNQEFDVKTALSAIVKLKNEEKYDWSTAYILKIFYKDWSHTKFFADYSKDIFSNRANVWPSGSYHQIKKDILKGAGGS